MPDPFNLKSLNDPDPSIGQQILRGLIRREPYSVIVPPAIHARDLAAPYVTYPVTGIPPGGEGKPKVPILMKKLFEEAGGLLLPGPKIKALTEIGEGEIPFVDRSGNLGGLGSGEEAQLQRDNEERRRKIAARYQPGVAHAFGPVVPGNTVGHLTGEPLFGGIAAVATNNVKSIMNYARRANVGPDSDDPSMLVAQTGDP